MAMVTMSSSAESYVGLAACEIIIPIMMMLLLLLLLLRLLLMMIMMMMLMIMTMMIAMTMLAACVCEMTCHNQRIADRVARIKAVSSLFIPITMMMTPICPAQNCRKTLFLWYHNIVDDITEFGQIKIFDIIALNLFHQRSKSVKQFVSLWADVCNLH